MKLAPIASGLLVLAALAATPAAAQTWARSYDFAPNSQDQAHAVRQTSDGGFIVAGQTDQSSGTNLAWVMKLDGGGNIQWEKTYGGSLGGETARDVKQLAGGGYVFVGQTFLNNSAEIWVVNLNANGTINWQHTYGPSGQDDGHAIQELSGGGFIVVGEMLNPNGDEDVYVLRLDGSGNVIWDHRYDAGSFDWGRGVWELSGGGFVVAAYAWNGTDYDMWVIELNAAGQPVWDRKFAGAMPGMASGDHAYAIQETSDQGLIVAGTTPNFNPANLFDVWVLKLDAQRLTSWQQTYDSGGADVAYSAQQTTDGGYVLAGYSFAAGGNVDFWTVRLTASGALEWERRLGGLVGEEAYAVHQTADAGFVVAGYSDSMGPGDRDFWIARLDRNGEMDCTCDYLGGGAGTTTVGTVANPGIFPVLPQAIPPAATAGTPAVTVQNSTATVTANCAGRSTGDVRASQAVNGAHEQEVSLALDPLDPNIQVLAYEDDPAGGPKLESLGVSFSSDAGMTWTDRQLKFGCDGLDNDVPPDGMIDEETLCDGQDDDFDGMIDEDLCCVLEHTHPTVEADEQGNFYATFLAHESNATSFSGSSYVAVARSSDGGNSWTGLPAVAQSVYNPLGPNVDFLDRPVMTVETDPFNPTNGDIHVAWQREDQSNPQNTNIFVSTLTGGAGSWSTPVQVNDPPGLQCAGAPQVDVVPGAVWALWRHDPRICPALPSAQFFVDQSMDRGQTFGVDQPGRTYNQIPASLYKHGYPTPDLVSLAVDPLNPVVLYVAYAERTGGLDEADIMFTESLDGGNSWSIPVRVNDDATIMPQYAPVVRTKVNNNFWVMVDVIWYDERHSLGCDRINDDPMNDPFADEEITNGLDDDGDGFTDEDVCDPLIDVYFARTVDTPGFNPLFGPNIRVTSTSFGLPGNPPNTIGDYISLATCDHTDYVAWADTRGTDNDVYTNIVPDFDSDGDTVLDQADCAPYDAGIFGRPGPVQNLAVAPIPASTSVSLSWTSQDPTTGTSTRYDLVSGLISELSADQNFNRAGCLVSDHPDTPYVDTRGNPPPGDGYYYLVRAENPCRDGGYGNVFPPGAPRLALSGSPCP